MKISIMLILALCSLSAEDREVVKFTSSMKEDYIIVIDKQYQFTVRNNIPLRIGDFTLTDKDGKLKIMLSFMCDTKDLSKYDTKEKLKKPMNDFQKNIKGGTVEDPIVVEDIKGLKRYGYISTVTDKQFENQMPTKEGDYKYWTFMAVRIGDDTVLLASVMSNNKNAAHDEAIKYCLSYEKR